MRFPSRSWISGGAVLSLILLLGISAPWTSRGPGDRSPARVTSDASGGRAGERPDASLATEPAPEPQPARQPAQQPASDAASREQPLAGRRERDPAAERSREADRLFSDLRVLRIEIDIPPDGEEALRGWHWRRGAASRPEVRATVREDGRIYRDVALQLKGAAGSFRSIDDEPALTLKFDKHVPEQRFHGLKKLSLNNSVQDPSFLSEKICRELFLEAGVPVPRAAHALVQLNGRHLGLRVLIEGFNKQFLKRHFGNTSGNLFDGGFVQDITGDLHVNSGDSPLDRSPLERLTEAASEPDDDVRLRKLGEVLDVERFLAFVALEVMTCHWDGYTMNRNNYRLFDDVETGRLVFLPHGLDQVFGNGRGSPLQPIIPRSRGLVAEAILETPDGRQRYLETLRRLYRKVFDLARILRRADEVAEPIRAVLAEVQPDRMQSFLYAVQSLKDGIRERARSISAQLAGPIERPLASDSGIVPLSGWRARTEAGDSEVVEEKGPEGRPCLAIRSGPDATVASWHTVLALAPGRYRFEGRVRCREVAGDDGRDRTGACLRVDGATSTRRLVGTCGWTALSHRFRVGRGRPSEVDLVCELRCDGGEAWFDKRSLRVVRE